MTLYLFGCYKTNSVGLTLFPESRIRVELPEWIPVHAYRVFVRKIFGNEPGYHFLVLIGKERDLLWYRIPMKRPPIRVCCSKRAACNCSPSYIGMLIAVMPSVSGWYSQVPSPMSCHRSRQRDKSAGASRGNRKVSSAADNSQKVSCRPWICGYGWSLHSWTVIRSREESPGIFPSVWSCVCS